MTQWETIIKPVPGLAILSIGDRSMFYEIGQMTEKYHGVWHHYDDSNHFHLKSRSYEYAIVETRILDNSKKAVTMKEIYHSLENSALILLLSPHRLGENDYDILEQCGFVAINSWNDGDYCVMCAKKMHMWGQGL